MSEGWLAVKKKCYWKSDAPSLKNVGQAVQTLFQLEENFSKDCNGTLLPKLFWHTVRKNGSSDGEKLLKFEAEGQEFAKILDH